MKNNEHFKKFHTDKAMGPGQKNYFRIESAFKPSSGDIEKAQIDLGFSPYGYGGPDDVETRIEGVKWITTWSCSYSCD